MDLYHYSQPRGHPSTIPTFILSIHSLIPKGKPAAHLTAWNYAYRVTESCTGHQCTGTISDALMRSILSWKSQHIPTFSSLFLHCVLTADRREQGMLGEWGGVGGSNLCWPPLTSCYVSLCLGRDFPWWCANLHFLNH